MRKPPTGTRIKLEPLWKASPRTMKPNPTSTYINPLTVSSFLKRSERAVSSSVPVMRRPVAREMRSAGNWDMRPSPMVRIEYVLKDSPSPAPPRILPTITPPIRLRTVTKIPNLTFPLTNLVAPSIVEKKLIS